MRNESVNIKSQYHIVKLLFLLFCKPIQRFYKKNLIFVMICCIYSTFPYVLYI